jgi:hypothetical protein
MTATGARDTCTCAGAAGPLASCGPRTAAAATAADPAKAIAKILAKVLTRVGFDRLVERGGIKRALDRWSYDASGILAKVVYYAIMLFVLSTAFGVFGSNPISDYLRAVIAYLPLVFVAVVIVVIAAGARNLIENSLGGLSYARVLANLASDSSWPSASSPPWTSCTSPPPWSTPSSTPYWPRSSAGRPPLLIRRGSRPCQRRHGRVPGGGIVIAAGGRGAMNYCLLPCVLGATDVTASADGPSQSGKVQLERDDVPHGEDDIAGSRHSRWSRRYDGKPGRRLAGRVLAGSAPHSQGGQYEGAEEYDDSDDEQVQQALGDHADDAERDRHDHEQQEKGNHDSFFPVRGSAAGQAPLAAGARLVGQAVVLEDGLFVAGRQFAVSIDRGGVLHLLPVEADLDVAGADRRVVEGHEDEPVPGRQPDRDGRERRLVGAGVDVDGFQRADLVAVGVHDVVAPPLPDIGRLEHGSPSFLNRGTRLRLGWMCGQG